MDAQEPPRPSVEDEFEQAFLAGDDPAWCAAELTAPGLVRDPLGGAVFLASSRAGDFRQPVDRRRRDLIHMGGEVEAERSAEGLASLVRVATEAYGARLLDLAWRVVWAGIIPE